MPETNESKGRVQHKKGGNVWSLTKLLSWARYVLLAALTITHGCFFGVPALQKFQQGNQSNSMLQIKNKMSEKQDEDAQNK